MSIKKKEIMKMENGICERERWNEEKKKMKKSVQTQLFYSLYNCEDPLLLFIFFL